MGGFLFLIAVILIAIFISIVTASSANNEPTKSSSEPFEHNNDGYDADGFDREGFDREGFDREGFDREGFNRQGYNDSGKNRNGKYDRFFDIKDYRTDIYNADGFMNPRIYTISLTDHARLRFSERLNIDSQIEMRKAAVEAYRFGKSSRQVRKSTAAQIEEIERKHENGTVLLYKGYVYVFSKENVLITLYKNDKITM